jgi:hypothetical protein
LNRLKDSPIPPAKPAALRPGAEEVKSVMMLRNRVSPGNMRGSILPASLALASLIVCQLPPRGVALAGGRDGAPPVVAAEGRRTRPGGAGGEPAGSFPILREPGSTTEKFYCGARIVAPGDTQAGVLEKCGEPARRERRREERIEAVTPDGTILTTVTTEEWLYNFGPERFLYHLKFRDDTLVEIKTGEYGY